MSDILWKTDDFVFSYRAAGILIRDGYVLLQKPSNDPGFAFPGGHVSFGETHEETLIREFREEIGASVTVGELVWVGELFFPWDSRRCQQICLYNRVKLTDGDSIPFPGVFTGTERFENRNFTMEFHWIPLDDAGEIEIYPTQAAELLKKLGKGVQHFLYRED